MKLAIAWLAALTVAAVTWVSCSVPHKSNDFACTSQADCAALPGRVCSGGFCVVTNGQLDAGGTDGRPNDAPNLPPDASSPVCPPHCTSCDPTAKTCKIDCAQTNCTSGLIACPTGWSCDIACSTPNSCRNGIDCTKAESCAISCGGQGSCRNIGCSTGSCLIECGGIGSCRGINCSQACACDVKCGDAASCEFVTCSSFQCDTFSGGCTSQRPGCNTCGP